jgi:hypothetical protein
MAIEPSPEQLVPEANRYHLQYLLAVALSMAVLLWTLAAEHPWGWLFPERVALELGGQVYLVPERDLERLARTRPDWLSGAEAQALERLEQGVRQELDSLFDRVHGRVPEFADWYYSTPGTALRLFAAIPYPSNKGDMLAEAVSERLFPPETWQAELNALERALSARYSHEFSAMEREWLTWLARELTPYRQDEPLPERQVTIDFNQRLHAQLADTLEADRIGIQMGAGLGAGTLLARGAITRVNARAASGRAAARLASRGTLGSGSAACGLAGPWAIGCGVMVFTAITLVTEWGLLRTDEALNRPALEQALHGSVDALHESMVEEYGRQLLGTFEASLGALTAGIHGSLRPIDRIRSTHPGRRPATTAHSTKD